MIPAGLFQISRSERRHRTEGGVLPLPFDEILSPDPRTLEHRTADAGEFFPDEYQPVRLRIRQRLQDHGINNSENGGVRADAQRENRNAHQGVARTLNQRAKGMPKVAQEIHQSNSTTGAG